MLGIGEWSILNTKVPTPTPDVAYILIYLVHIHILYCDPINCLKSEWDNGNRKFNW